ncbi:MAG: permease, partial [Candidatus Kapaibacterium sp.]
ILTAKVLGVDIGVARAVGAIVFSIVIGLIMHFIYRKEELAKVNTMAELPEPEMKRKLWQNVIYFALMIFILIFANWGHAEPDEVFFYTIWQLKWVLTSISGILFAVVLAFWFDVHKMRLIIATIPVVLLTVFFYEIPMIPFAGAIIALGWLTATDKDDDMQNWFVASWDFTKQIAPLLVWGVLIAGFALGRPGNEGIIPSEWIHNLVGGNSLSANLFASVVGALMYFATLTEIPIVQGLVGSGMGKGPALALLLAGPALSLPNMLVIRSVIGIKKTAVFVTLVVIMATISGYIFGLL